MPSQVPISFDCTLKEISVNFYQKFFYGNLSPLLFAIFFATFSPSHFYCHFLLSLFYCLFLLSLVFATQTQTPCTCLRKHMGFHSFPIPIFDVSASISLHHLLHHFCLKLHHFPINYDTSALSPKSRKPLKTLTFQAFSEVLKSCKHKFNKFLLVCFHV